MNIDEIIDKVINEICDDFYRYSKHTDTKELVEINEKIHNLYWNDERFENIKYDLDWIILEDEVANEKHGFVLGFKKAMEMFEEALSLTVNLDLINLMNFNSQNINISNDLISEKNDISNDIKFKIILSVIRIFIIGYGQKLIMLHMNNIM